jgi:hypothetical protein
MLGLFRIPAGGGAPAPLTQTEGERGEATHRWPQIQTGGRSALFTANKNGYGWSESCSS